MATEKELAHITAQIAAGHDQTPGAENHDADNDPVVVEMRQIATDLKPMLEYVEHNVAPLIARYEELALKKGPVLKRHNVHEIMNRLKHDLDFIADVASTGE